MKKKFRGGVHNKQRGKAYHKGAFVIDDFALQLRLKIFKHTNKEILFTNIYDHKYQTGDNRAKEKTSSG